MKLSIYLCLATVVWLVIQPVAQADENTSYAFLVGVQHYSKGESKGRYASLPYTPRDLLKMRDILLKIGFKDENIRIYSDATSLVDSSKEVEEIDYHYYPRLAAAEIEEQLGNFMRQIKEGDTLVVYLTGHGGVVKKHRYFAVNATKPRLLSTFLGVDTLLKLMGEEAPYANKLLVMDTCANPVLNPQSSAIPTTEPPDYLRVEQMYSSKLEKVSRFDHKIKMSVFTFYLIKALQEANKYPFGNMDQEITTDELIKYVKKHVPKHRNSGFQSDRNQGQLPSELLDRLEENTPQEPDGISIEAFAIATVPSGECYQALSRKKGESREAHSARIERCLARYE